MKKVDNIFYAVKSLRKNISDLGVPVNSDPKSTAERCLREIDELKKKVQKIQSELKLCEEDMEYWIKEDKFSSSDGDDYAFKMKQSVEKLISCIHFEISNHEQRH